MKRGMKHKDFKPCHICGKGVMHSGSPLFIRISVERHGVDLRAVQRAHGMELFLGNAKLANVMGADEDLTQVIDSAEDILICHDCGDNPLPPYFWLRDDEQPNQQQLTDSAQRVTNKEGE